MQSKTVIHRLSCDICKNDLIEDGTGEASYAKFMRRWAKERGWGYHKGKDYCPDCEHEYNKNITK